MLQATGYNLQANNLPFDLGNNIFESMRAYGGKIFCLREHLERLEESAKSISVKLPCSREDLRQKIYKELKRAGLKEAYIRVSVNFLGEINIIISPPKNLSKRILRKRSEGNYCTDV